MWTGRPVATLLCALTLACVVARADDTRKAADPDPGFLEFLGSVDRLAETNPDYLSSAARGADPPPAKPQAAKPPPPPPGPPPAPPQNAAGAKNND